MCAPFLQMSVSLELSFFSILCFYTHDQKLFCDDEFVKETGCGQCLIFLYLLRPTQPAVQPFKEVA